MIAQKTQKYLTHFNQADSDDENMEQEIDDNIDQLSAVTGRLNMLARATGQEVDHQNKILQRVSEKVSLFTFHPICDSACESCMPTGCSRVTRLISGLQPIRLDWTAFARTGTCAGALAIKVCRRIIRRIDYGVGGL